MKVYRVNRHVYEWIEVAADDEAEAVALAKEADLFEEWHREEEPTIDYADDMTDECTANRLVYARVEPGDPRGEWRRCGELAIDFARN